MLSRLLFLENISNLYLLGGKSDPIQGSLSPTHTSVKLTILTNDDPHGVIAFATQSREMTVAEDYEEGMSNTTQTTFTVERNQGLSGGVQVCWIITMFLYQEIE